MSFPFKISTEAVLDSACDRLRLLSLLTITASVFIAAVLAPVLGVHWSQDGSAGAVVSISLLLAAGLLLRCLGGAKRLATFAEVEALMMLGTIAAAAVGMVALRSGAPMADSALEATDSLLGLSAQSVVAWVATWRSSLEPLRILYNSAFPEAAGSVLLLSIIGRRLETWRLCFLFLVTLLSCAIISFAIPAYGSFVHAAPATLKGLPPGAGTFWWDALNRCRSATVAVLTINDLGGVIAFPSFHTVIALLIMQAWFWNRWLRFPVIGWNLAVLFTTLPIGGHYFVDLIAGALLWFTWSAAAERVVNGANPIAWRERLLMA
jgi:membrane-associated phospholipid phosphatase